MLIFLDIPHVKLKSKIKELPSNLRISNPILMCIEKLSIKLYSNENNELRKLLETPVSFLSTNDIANARNVISTIHDSKVIHSLVFIDYIQIPRERFSRPILSEILDTLKVERVVD